MNSKRRAWFQFHLSTALAVMFAAGGLIWANTATRDYGWPFAAVKTYDVRAMTTKGCISFTSREVQYTHIALDAALGLTLCGALAFVCERISRGDV